MQSITLFARKLHPDAKIPTRAYDGDAGLDLYSIETKTISLNGLVEVRTGVAIEIPRGYFGFIGTRSSFGKKGMRVHAGVIDAGYRGEITLFISAGKDAYSIHTGDKIAQLIILPIPNTYICEVEELSKSERGTNNLGSSGR